MRIVLFVLLIVMTNVIVGSLLSSINTRDI